jgi:Transposase and inactivated derivatives
MVLGYSRMMYIEFAKRCDIHSFLSCLIHALQYFGGVPKTMLTDQMKTVILGMGEDRKPRWHPLFEDFCRNDRNVSESLPRPATANEGQGGTGGPIH